MNRGRYGRVPGGGVDAPGQAEVWVKFIYTAALGMRILASHNVASVVRNGLGDYTITFQKAFTSPHFAFAMTVGYTSGLGALTNIATTDPGLAGSKRILVINVQGATLADLETHFMAFGELT